MQRNPTEIDSDLLAQMKIKAASQLVEYYENPEKPYKKEKEYYIFVLTQQLCNERHKIVGEYLPRILNADDPREVFHWVEQARIAAEKARRSQDNILDPPRSAARQELPSTYQGGQYTDTDLRSMGAFSSEPHIDKKQKSPSEKHGLEAVLSNLKADFWKLDKDKKALQGRFPTPKEDKESYSEDNKNSLTYFKVMSLKILQDYLEKSQSKKEKLKFLKSKKLGKQRKELVKESLNQIMNAKTPEEVLSLLEHVKTTNEQFTKAKQEERSEQTVIIRVAKPTSAAKVGKLDALGPLIEELKAIRGHGTELELTESKPKSGMPSQGGHFSQRSRSGSKEEQPAQTAEARATITRKPSQ